MYSDPIRGYLGGASVDGAGQHDPIASVGGFCSSVPCEGLSARRSGLLFGVSIDYAACANGVGTGMLEAISGNVLRWTPPGGAAGDSVTVMNGETADICGSDPSKFVTVTRKSSMNMVGIDQVFLAEQYNNVVSMDDVPTELQADGGITYSTLFLRNVGAVDISGFVVWPKQPNVRVGVDLPIVALSNALPEEPPISVTWSTGNDESGGVVIPKIPNGFSVPVWIERTIESQAQASPCERVDVEYKHGAPPLPAVDTSGITITEAGCGGGGYKNFRFSYYSSSTGRESQAGPILKSPDVVSSGFYINNIPFSSDPIVDKVKVYATPYQYEDGGEMALESIVDNIDAGGGKLAPVLSWEQGPSGPAFVEYLADWTEYNGCFSGLYRVENEELVGYRLYLGIDGAPDFTQEAHAVFTGESYEIDGISEDAEYHVVVRARNKYGLESQNTKAEILRFGATKPTAPELLKVGNDANGNPVISGIYNAIPDKQDRADTFLVYLDSTGAEPNPETDAPVHTLSMLNAPIDVLQNAVIPVALPDGAVIKSVIRASNTAGDDPIDSDSSDVITHTISTIGADRPRGHGFYSRIKSQARTAQGWNFEQQVFDADKGILFDPNIGVVDFWCGVDLVWRCVWDSGNADICKIYMPSDWGLRGRPLVAGVGNASPVEVAAWEESDKTVYITIYSGMERCIKLDVIEKVMYASFTQLREHVNYTARTPVYQRADSVAFQIFDPSSEDWVTYAEANGGSFCMNCPMSQRLTQEEILSL